MKNRFFRSNPSAYEHTYVSGLVSISMCTCDSAYTQPNLGIHGRNQSRAAASHGHENPRRLIRSLIDHGNTARRKPMSCRDNTLLACAIASTDHVCHGRPDRGLRQARRRSRPSSSVVRRPSIEIVSVAFVCLTLFTTNEKIGREPKLYTRNRRGEAQNSLIHPLTQREKAWKKNLARMLPKPKETGQVLRPATVCEQDKGTTRHANLQVVDQTTPTILKMRRLPYPNLGFRRRTYRSVLAIQRRTMRTRTGGCKVQTERSSCGVDFILCGGGRQERAACGWRAT
jgi:hypothetical protein